MAAGLYVVFSLDDQAYGVEVHTTREVLGFRKITPLPEPQGFAQGLISLRGVFLPVFDLREKFHLPARGFSRFQVIIVVETAGKQMGVIADELSGVMEILPEEVQTIDCPPFGLRPEYLIGVGKKGERMIFLLNMDRILDAGKLERERDDGQDSGNRRQQVDRPYSEGDIGQTGT